MGKNKAIILAGGYGTRLRPITATRPKPMCEVMSEPVLGRIIRLLKQANICEIVVSAMYMSDSIIEYVNRFKSEIKISCVVENKALGSAGGTKFASKNISLQQNDTLLVLSGDGIFDFNLQDALKYHRNKNSDFTMITTETAYPTEFGVILSDDSGKITSIIEKPSWKKVKSDTVNTGIYILKKNIFKYIPDGIFFDFSKDLFPILLEENKKMYQYPGKGYWCDIGDITSYYRCNMDAINSLIGNFSSLNSNEAIERKEEIIQESNVTIDNYSIIGKNVKIGKDSSVVASIIFDNVTIGNNTKVNNSIICENCCIGNDVKINSGCTVGANVIINDAVSINNGISIKQNTIIKRGYIVSSDINFNLSGKDIYLEDGFNAGLKNELPDPEYISRLGRAIVNTVVSEKSFNNNSVECRIGVCHSSSKECALIADALLFSVKSSGATGLNFKQCFEAQAIYASKFFVNDIVLYVCEADENFVIKLFCDNNIIDMEILERKIENEYKNPHTNNRVLISDINTIDNLHYHYFSNIILKISKIFKTNRINLKGISCYFPDLKNKNSPNELLLDIVEELGGEINQYNKDKNIVISISDTGLDAMLEQNSGKTVSFDTFHITAVVRSYFIRQEGSAITHKEFSNPFEKFDMCCTILSLLYILKQTGKNLEQLQSYIPEFVINIKDMTTDELGIEKRAKVMKSLYSENNRETAAESKEGVTLKFENGKATVIPKRTGGFKIITEAVNTEFAREISGIIIEKIKNI